MFSSSMTMHPSLGFPAAHVVPSPPWMRKPSRSGHVCQNRSHPQCNGHPNKSHHHANPCTIHAQRQPATGPGVGTHRRANDYQENGGARTHTTQHEMSKHNGVHAPTFLECLEFHGVCTCARTYVRTYTMAPVIALDRPTMNPQ